MKARPIDVGNRHQGPLAISLRHAEAAGVLRIAHRDPVDRMLIAQAHGEDMWPVSNETLFDSFGVRRFW